MQNHHSQSQDDIDSIIDFKNKNIYKSRSKSDEVLVRSEEYPKFNRFDFNSDLTLNDSSFDQIPKVKFFIGKGLTFL